MLVQYRLINQSGYRRHESASFIQRKIQVETILNYTEKGASLRRGFRQVFLLGLPGRRNQDGASSQGDQVHERGVTRPANNEPCTGDQPRDLFIRQMVKDGDARNRVAFVAFTGQALKDHHMEPPVEVEFPEDDFFKYRSLWFGTGEEDEEVGWRSAVGGRWSGVVFKS